MVCLDFRSIEIFDTDIIHEDRFIRIGYSYKTRLLTVVFCERDDEHIRIISARGATAEKRDFMKKDYDLKKMRTRPAKVYPEAAKTAINVRLDTSVVANIKYEAHRLGIPYQTLINSILHRFTTGELIDKGIKKTGS